MTDLASPRPHQQFDPVPVFGRRQSHPCVPTMSPSNFLTCFAREQLTSFHALIGHPCVPPPPQVKVPALSIGLPLYLYFSVLISPGSPLHCGFCLFFVFCFFLLKDCHLSKPLLPIFFSFRGWISQCCFFPRSPRPCVFLLFLLNVCHLS